jgi:hypothetical protein
MSQVFVVTSPDLDPTSSASAAIGIGIAFGALIFGYWRSWKLPSGFGPLFLAAIAGIAIVGGVVLTVGGSIRGLFQTLLAIAEAACLLRARQLARRTAHLAQ